MQKEKVIITDLTRFKLIYWTEVRESLRSFWFYCYLFVVFGLIVGFLGFGLTDSQLLGFVGIDRALMTYVQLMMVVLPGFILVTTARSFVADRDLGVWEYQLSWPLSRAGFFWAKSCARVTILFTPIAVCMIGISLYGYWQMGSYPFALVSGCMSLLFALVVAFTGIAMLLTVLATSQEFAIGLALGIWLLVATLIDTLLIGLLVQGRILAEWIVGMALLNPLQAFRTASIVLFDPELTMLGTISFALLETIGKAGLISWAIVWPIAIGLGCAWLGQVVFCKRDLIT